jgi:hypothetical protein
VRYTPITTTVKSGAGQRVIALDQLTTAVLRDHLACRDRWQKTCGPSWPDTGLFFLAPTGKPWHPGMVSHRFDQLVAGSGLPRSACTTCATVRPPTYAPPGPT